MDNSCIRDMESLLDDLVPRCRQIRVQAVAGIREAGYRQPRLKSLLLGLLGLGNRKETVPCT